MSFLKKKYSHFFLIIFATVTSSCNDKDEPSDRQSPTVSQVMLNKTELSDGSEFRSIKAGDKPVVEAVLSDNQNLKELKLKIHDAVYHEHGTHAHKHPRPDGELYSYHKNFPINGQRVAWKHIIPTKTSMKKMRYYVHFNLYDQIGNETKFKFIIHVR